MIEPANYNTSSPSNSDPAKTDLFRGYVAKKVDSGKYLIEIQGKMLLLQFDKNDLKQGQTVKVNRTDKQTVEIQQQGNAYRATVLNTDRFTQNTAIDTSDLTAIIGKLALHLHSKKPVNTEDLEKILYMLKKFSPEKSSSAVEKLIQKISVANEQPLDKNSISVVDSLITEIKEQLNPAGDCRSFYLQNRAKPPEGIYGISSELKLRELFSSSESPIPANKTDFPMILQVQHHHNGTRVTLLDETTVEHTIQDLKKTLDSPLLKNTPDKVYKQLFESKNQLSVHTINRLDTYLVSLTKGKKSSPVDLNRAELIGHWLRIISDNPHLIHSLASRAPDSSVATIPKLLMSILSGSENFPKPESFFINESTFESGQNRQDVIIDAFGKAGYNHESGAKQDSPPDLKDLIYSFLNSSDQPTSQALFRSTPGEDRIIQLLSQIHLSQPEQLSKTHLTMLLSAIEDSVDLVSNQSVRNLITELDKTVAQIKSTLQAFLISNLCAVTPNTAGLPGHTGIEKIIADIMNQCKDCFLKANERTSANTKTFEQFALLIEKTAATLVQKTSLLSENNYQLVPQDGQSPPKNSQPASVESKVIGLYSSALTDITNHSEQFLKSAIVETLQNQPHSVSLSSAFSIISDKQNQHISAALSTLHDQFITDLSNLLKMSYAKGVFSDNLITTGLDLVALSKSITSSISNTLSVLAPEPLRGSQTSAPYQPTSDSGDTTVSPHNQIPKEALTVFRSLISTLYSENSRALSSALQEFNTVTATFSKLLDQHSGNSDELRYLLEQLASKFSQSTGELRGKLESHIRSLLLKLSPSLEQPGSQLELPNDTTTTDNEPLQTSGYKQFLRQTAETLLNRLETFQLLSHTTHAADGQNQIVALPIKIGEEWSEVHIKLIKKRNAKRKHPTGDVSILLNVNPSSIGEVSMQLDYSNKKYLTINFSFESEDTKNWFKSMRKDIQNSIQNLGFTISKLQFGNRTTNRPQSTNKSKHNASDRIMDVKI